MLKQRLTGPAAKGPPGLERCPLDNNDVARSQFPTVLGIRIRRIRMLFGLLDPDPFVKRSDSGSGSGSGPFSFLIKVLSGLSETMLPKHNFNTKF